MGFAGGISARVFAFSFHTWVIPPFCYILKAFRRLGKKRARKDPILLRLAPYGQPHGKNPSSQSGIAPLKNKKAAHIKPQRAQRYSRQRTNLTPCAMQEEKQSSRLPRTRPKLAASQKGRPAVCHPHRGAHKQQLQNQDSTISTNCQAQNTIYCVGYRFWQCRNTRAMSLFCFYTDIWYLENRIPRPGSYTGDADSMPSAYPRRKRRTAAA